MSGLVTRRSPVTSSPLRRVTPTGLIRAREALSGAGGGGGAAPEGWAYKWDAADLSGAGDGGVISADWGSEAALSPTGSPVYRAEGLDGNPAVEFNGSSYFRGTSADAGLPQPYCVFIALQLPAAAAGAYPFTWNTIMHCDHFTGSGRVAGTLRLGAPTFQNFPDGPHHDASVHALAALVSGADTEFVNIGGTTSDTVNPGAGAFGGVEHNIIGGSFNGATPPGVVGILPAGSLVGEVLVYNPADLTEAGEILTQLTDYGLSKYPSVSA